MRRLPTVGLLISLLLTTHMAALAQTSNGTIAGTVVDTAGASIAKATVTIVATHTGISRSTTTNAVGTYRLESVLLDTYAVTAEASGFSKRSISNVVVNASVVTSVNPVLLPGSVEQTIKVEAASDPIQTDSGELSDTLGTQAVANLPIDSLSPYELATTLPGVSEPPAVFQNVGGMPNGFQFSVNGSRPRANNYLIEGQDNNDMALHGQGLQPENIEAYRDVTFLLNSSSAEFGHGGGSVGNLILKSGTNQIHGAVWDRLENSSLDAIDKGDLFNGATSASKYRENIAGFSVGGPVLTDKLFFFASYQFDHYRATTNLNPVIVPTATGLTALQALSTNPRVANYLTAVGGLIGQTGTANTSSLTLTETNPATSSPYIVLVGPYRRNLKNASDSSELDIKSDYIISSVDTFQLHYIRAPYLTPINTSNAMLPGFDTNIDAVSHNAGIAESHTFNSDWMNEFRLSYGRIGFTFGLAAATLANPLAQGPAINIGTPASQVTGFGSRTGYPQGRFHNTYQIQDTVSWSHDKHSIRAGFDLPVIQVRDLLATNSLGTLNYAGVGTKYSALADYVDDFAGSGGSITQVFGNPIARPVFYYQNYFVQDNWNITANLHLELGLRYEYSGTPFNNVPFPAVTADSVSNFTAAVSEQADTADWGPRFGFAYTPAFLGEKKTVIRGGFGIFYDGLFTQFEDNMMASAPNAAAPDKTSTASASQPRGTAALSSLFSTLNQRPAATDFAEYITPQMASPRMLQWNLNLERELPGLFTAQIGYVGTRGEHLFATTEFNPYVNDTTGSYARIFNTRGRIVREDNTGDSIYHALQTSLVRKYRNGLLFRAAYTFSRAEDDTSEIFSEGLYSTFATAQFPSARKTTDYGLSAFDHRQRLVFSYVYAIPKWSEVPRSVSEVVNGWQLSGVTQFQSGSPANVVIGYDWNGDGILNDRPEVGNPKAPLASFAIKGDDPIQGFGLTAGTYCDGPSWLYTSNPCVQVPLNSVHWVLPYFGTRGNPVGRNNVILRGFEQWDFSAQKSFKTCKEQSFDFRAEMFDVFNHGDTGTPNLEIWNGFADPTNPSTGTSFGNYTTTVSGHRSIRMLLRYSF